MHCPRCGHLNEGTAQACEQCGSPLPALRRRMRRSPSEGPVHPSVPEPVDAVWREADGVASSPIQGQNLPNWLETALRDEPSNSPTGAAPWQADPQQLGPVYPAPSSSPAVPSAPSFGLEPNFGGAADAVPEAFDAGGLIPYQGGGAYGPEQSVYPISGGIVTSQPPGLPTEIPPEYALVPASSPGRMSADTSTALVQALGPGTLLKGGRYRLIQRFHSTIGAQYQSDEPPLMMASDTEVPNGRVLIQELLLGSVRPEDSDNARRMIAQRLQGLAQSHGVPQLVDSFSERRRHFLVFELPAGDLLLDRIQRAHGPIEETTAVGYALQLLDVLAVFERQRVPFIHGNISPANIILRPSGQIVLVGMSPTLLMHPDGTVESGQAGGMPGYAAPEQSRRQATPRSDLFAVCAVLHHAATGVAPSPRANGAHPPARHLNPNVSLELEDVLSHGLRLASAQRFQSVGDLRRALQPLASGRRVTRVPEELRSNAQAGMGAALAPVRDARGRLVLPRQRLSQNPLFLIMAVLALILVVGGGTLFAVAPHPGNTGTRTATATPNGIAALYQAKGIGLSGGEFVFDSQRQDNELKQNAARALASGDAHAALTYLQSAISQDQSDAEAAIYATDMQILLSKSPYVTVVAAVAFGNDDAAARAELQGVYLAQSRVNAFDLLPGNTRVRVLVLNSGQSPSDATTASNVLLSEIKSGNAQHLVGIIGWPASEQTRLAISALAPSGLAIVSPTASADHLGGVGNFFAMVPSDSQQAAELADGAATQLNAQHILVLADPNNVASSAVASSFVSELQQSAGPRPLITQANYVSGGTTDFTSLAQQAVAQNADWIFLAAGDSGGDQDAVYLARAVAHINAIDGVSIHILADSRAYSSAILGIGTSPVAQAAHSNAAALATLRLTMPADQNEATALDVTNSPASSFSNDYVTQFGAAGEPNGLSGPDATSILSYDATRVLLAATAHEIHLMGGSAASPDPTHVRLRLLQYDSSHPYMGVGGAVAFTPTGAQPVKALTLVQLTPVADPSSNGPVVNLVIYAVIGGTDLYCGSTKCTSA